MVRSVLTFAVLLLAGAPAPAAPPANGKPITFPFPADCAAVACASGYDTARDRLKVMLTAGLPGEAPILTPGFGAFLDKTFYGHTLKGVRRDARVFAVLPDIRQLGNWSTVSVLVPVTKYGEFRDAFLTAEERKRLVNAGNGVEAVERAAAVGGGTVYLTDLKDYVAISTDKQVALSYAGAYTRASSTLLGPELTEALVKADFAVYLNMVVVNQQIGDKIRQLKELFEKMMQQLLDQSKIPGIGKRGVNAMKATIKAAFQGLEDCQALVLAAEFRPEGLLLQGQIRFGPDTLTAQLIPSNLAPSPDLGALPAGFTSYTASRLGDSFGNLLDDFNAAFAPADGDDRPGGPFDQYLKEKAAAGVRRQWYAEVSPGTGITIGEYRDPARAVRALLAGYKTIGPGGTIKAVFVKSVPVIVEQSVKHRGFTFTEIRVHYDLAATAARLPEGPLRQLLLDDFKLRVTEKTNIWVGTDGKTVVRLTGKDWATVKGTLDAYLDGKRGVAAEKGFQLARRNLPDTAVYVTFEETRATITRSVPLFRPLLKMIPGFPEIPKLTPVKGDPTYLGSAVTLQGDTAGFLVFVPAQGMAVVNQMFTGSANNP